MRSRFAMTSKWRLLCLAAVLLAGLAVLVSSFYLEKKVAVLIVEELQSELEKSCPECRLKHSGIKLSLLAGKGVILHPRIVKDGEDRLSFVQVRGTFGLRSVLSPTIDLNLFLEEGHAEGLGPGSVTFEFIDQLTTPSEGPPPLVRVVLQNLTATSTTFSEKVSRGVIGGKDLSLSLSRTNDSLMLLKPELEQLTWLASHWEVKEPVNLGKLKSIMTLGNGNIKFHQLSLQREQALLKMTGESIASQLNGKLKIQGDTESIDHENIASGTFHGGGSVSGTLGKPVIHAQVEASSGPEKPLIFFLNKKPLLDFKNVSADLYYDHQRDLTTITNIAGTGEKVSLHSPSEVSIKDIDMQALFTLDIEELELAGLVGKNVHASVSYNGSSLNPFLPEVRLEMESLNIGPFTFEGVSADVATTTEKIDVEAHTPGKTVRASVSINPDTGVVSSGRVKLQDHKFEHSVGILDLTTTISGEMKTDGGAEIPYKGTLSTTTSHPVFGLLDLTHKVSGDLQTTRLLSRHEEVMSSSLLLHQDPELASSLNLELSSLPLSIALPDCFDTSIDLDYEFSSSAILLGDGKMLMKKLTWGCPPKAMQLESLAEIPVSDGTLVLRKTALKGFQDSLTMTGKISPVTGVDLDVEGQASLSHFSIFVPSIDELRGTINLNASITGPVYAPAITGDALLIGGALASEQAGISIERLSGRIKVDTESVTLDELEGVMNEGQIALSGTIFPFDITRSRLFTTFDGVLVEPSTDTYFVAAGDLKLTADDDLKPTIEGELEIQEGEFRKSFDLKTLTSDLTQSFENDQNLNKPTELPPIDLNLDIKAERDLFIITNLLEAELSADLTVSGKLNRPQIKGTLNTLGGWFGLNNRQFDISNGTVRFSTADNRPMIDIVGETIIRTRIGETTNVVLEAEGPLDNPVINLAADREIPQSELITLLATNQRGVFENRRSRGVTPLSAKDLFRFGLPYFLGKFFDRLTQIDYFSIEPTYNLLTSTIQPSMVAEKRIFENVYLRGQALFGGNFTESSLKLFNELDTQYQLSFGIESASTNQNNALAIDLSYTVLEAFSTDLIVDISGNKFATDRKIKDISRVNEFSSVKAERAGLIEEKIIEFYQDEGYTAARVSVECVEVQEICSRLSIKISEGSPRKIKRVDLKSDLPEDLQQALFETVNIQGKRASKDLVDSVTRQVQLFLHGLGYYRADIRSELLPENRDSTLVLQIESGQPVKVIFWGNTSFSEQELLQQMQLLERRRPLGINSLRRGIENIERLYRENGFLYTSISYQEDEQPDKLYFNIYIHEESEITVDEVRIHGNDTVALPRLLKKMGDNAKNFKTPQYAVAEDIEYHAFELKRIYADLGFPNAQIRTALESDEDPTNVNISYYIEEGEPVYAKNLKVEGLPDGITPPTALKAPFSIPAANRYVRETYDRLLENGFRFASIWSEFDADSDTVKIQVEPGPLTIIGRISIQGNSIIAEKEIRSRLLVAEGDPWSESKISASRRNLLKSGLFSRIIIKPGDGEIDDSLEDMLVEVVERPLRSLVVGTGANSLFGLHIFGEYTDKEVFADGRKLTLRSDLYIDGLIDSREPEISQGIASIIHTNPNVFSTGSSLVSDLRFQKLTTLTQEFDVERIASTNLLNLPVSDYVTTSIGHTLTFDNIVSVPDDIKLTGLDSGNVRLGFISGSTTLDLRDYPLNPRNGFTTSLNYKFSVPLLLSEASFYQIGMRSTALTSFGNKFTLAGLSRWGYSETFASTDAVPITQRFYLGGRASVRGFRENSLGPRGSEGNVIGGELLQSNSVELQYRLYPEVEIHAFFDSGSMALNSDRGELWNYRTSAGFGSRYLSPIGPVGFDIGFPLREEEGEPSVRLHFNIGSQF